MTNLESIQEDLRPYPVRSSVIERKCNQYGLSISQEWNIENEPSIKKIDIEILQQMVTLNNVAEGGVSLSFNEKNVNAYIKRLCDEIGLDSSKYVSEAKVTRLE